MWQHVKLSVQIRPWDTLACCWDVKQPTNNNNSKKSVCRQCFCTRLGLSCWDVGCLTSQQQASVSQGQVCSDNFTCCHTETEVADPTFYLTQSQYTDTRPTSPSADPITPGAWQGIHSTSEKFRRKWDSNLVPSALEADTLPLGQRGGLLVESC